MRTPTHFPLDSRPRWSIFNVLLPATDLPHVQAEGDWVPGVTADYWTVPSTGAPMLSTHPGSADSYADSSIAGVDDPAAYPEAVLGEASTGVAVSYPTGLKGSAGGPQRIGVRPWWVRTDEVLLELWQQADLDGDPGAYEMARTALLAAAEGQVSDELVSGVWGKNTGLARAVALSEAVETDSADLSPAGGAATVERAMSALYEAAGARENVLGVPRHALPFLGRNGAGLVHWETIDGIDQLVDCYGSLVCPLDNGRGPLTDPDDLDTQETPDAGEGWLWLMQRPYGSVTDVRPRSTGDGPRQRGRARENQDTDIAEAVALVTTRPDRVLCCNTIFNTTTP